MEVIGPVHFEALKQFWDYTKSNPWKVEALSERVAYVLPNGYGYGFRGPNDKIWGFWEDTDDPLSYNVSLEVGNYLDEYGTKLDIIYDEGKALDATYSKYIFWNGTVISGS